MNLLFAQETSTNKDYTDNNINVNKTEFRADQNFINNSLSSSNDKIKTTVNKYNLNINKEIRKSFIDNFFRSRSSGSSHQKPEKNLVTSFSQNIEMGGLSGGCAVISFTPKLNLEPAEFMSISANQNVRYSIPIKTINENLELLFFQSAYILGIDNFINLLPKTHSITQSIAGFIAKNFITSLVSRFIDNNSKNKAIPITSYNYSITIRL
jgi:hypothetical protein